MYIAPDQRLFPKRMVIFDGRNRTIDGRQTRIDYGCRQQPVDRLGHRSSRCSAWRRIGPDLSGRRAEKRVDPLAAEAGCKLVIPCDVTDAGSIDQAFEEIGKSWGALDFLVHAIAFSDKEQLSGRYLARHPTISTGRSLSRATASPRSRSGQRSSCRMAAHSSR